MMFFKTVGSPNKYHVVLNNHMTSLCGKLPTKDEDLVPSFNDEETVCKSCERRLKATQSIYRRWDRRF